MTKKAIAEITGPRYLVYHGNIYDDRSFDQLPDARAHYEKLKAEHEDVHLHDTWHDMCLEATEDWWGAA